jgi:ketosteroid isomerase-like protein
MSQENVEIVRQRLHAFQTGGLDAALEFVAEDTVWYPFPDWVEDSACRGKEGVRKVTSIWIDNFDEFAVEVHELRDAGDKVVGLTVNKGKIKGAGTPVSQPIGTVYDDFRDGTSHRAHFFETWKQALEAAGLSK